MKTYQELIVERAELDARIHGERKVAKRELKKQMLVMIRDAGFQADDFFKATKEVRAKAKPKHLNSKTGATWCGRGRKPLWVGTDVHVVL